jgi:uncharacterized repeat protein (TIGR03803 family)
LSGGCGTVFQIADIAIQLLRRKFFLPGRLLARRRAGPGTGGNFYGITSETAGSIFEITPGGSLTTLYSFSQIVDGNQPQSGLIQGTNGTFYGTAYSGGANARGTVFSLSVGLGPFVETLPASGRVGTKVKILGTGLTGATSVIFNGIAAAFTVVSDSEIATKAPAGATTGTVQVTLPGGTTLSSNVPFSVLP